MRSLHTRFITIALALVVTSTTHAQDAVQVDLIATLRIPGDALDRSGLNDKLEDGTPANQLGGMSAIDYTGSDDRFMILSDRGAGMVRFHTHVGITKSRCG